MWVGQADGLGPGLQARLLVRDAAGKTLLDTALAGASTRVDVVQADGSRSLLAVFAARAGWERRFRLVTPERVRPGARVEVSATWESPAGVAQPGVRLLGLDIVADD